jgi:hypothetical protein
VFGGPTAGVIAKMPTEPAAALLASLPEQVAANVVMQLPAKERMAIVTAMAVLTAPAVPVPPPTRGGAEVGNARLTVVD